MRAASVLLSLVLPWLFVGCGFHLRGATPLAPPLKRIYIQTRDPYGELTRNLKQFLALSGATVTTTPQTANVILDILNERPGEQLLSVGGTQQTRQYNLTLTVTFQLTTPQGKTLVPSKSVQETQAVTIQSDQILGGSNEETTIYQQLRRKMVYSIMNILSSKETSTLVTQK